MQRERTFAALLPTDLSHRTKRQVELYNQGIATLHPHPLALRFNEVLAAEPDMILWILTPFDVDTELPNPEPPNALREPDLWSRLKEAFTKKPIPDALSDLWERSQRKLSETASGTLLLHFLYQSQSQYVKSYLAGGGN